MSDLDTAPPWRKGGWGLVITLALCAALSAVAFFLGSRNASPQQGSDSGDNATGTWTQIVERHTNGPEPLAGVLHRGGKISVSVEAPSGVSKAVLTKVLVRSGQSIDPGRVLAVVSGRPVILVKNEWPFYRDLHPGDFGDDVKALQAILRRDGLQSPTDGTFGAGTQAALANYYTRRGYVAQQGDPAAQSAVTRAERALSKIISDPAATAHQRTAAQGKLSAARLAAGAWLPLAEFFETSANRVRVEHVARVGSVLTSSDSLMTLQTGDPRVVARADALTLPSFSVGTEVQVVPDGTTQRLTGRVTSVGPFTAGDGTASGFPGHDITVSLKHPEQGDSAADGTQVTVAPLEGSAATKIAIPLVALREDSRGSYVLRRDPAGKPHRVDVTVESQSDGYALTSGDGLSVGDEVRIGAPPS